MTINWDYLPNFKASEFSEDPNEHAHPVLLKSVQSFRADLGHPFIPSPAPGALARFDKKSKDSKHYAVGQFSEALDGFPDCDIFEAFIIAVNSRLFNGIGVYFDTHLKDEYKPMLHLDLREHRLMWFRAGGVYKYSTEKYFYQKLLSQFNLHKIYDKR